MNEEHSPETTPNPGDVNITGLVYGPVANKPSMYRTHNSTIDPRDIPTMCSLPEIAINAILQQNDHSSTSRILMEISPESTSASPLNSQLPVTCPPAFQHKESTVANLCSELETLPNIGNPPVSIATLQAAHQASSYHSTHSNPEDHIFCCDDFQIERYRANYALTSNQAIISSDLAAPPSSFQESTSVNCVLVPSTSGDSTTIVAESSPSVAFSDNGVSQVDRKVDRIQVQRCENAKQFTRVIDNIGGKGKLWQCTECEKIFKGVYELERHVRVHTGERPYVCPDCGKGFSLTSNFYKHVRKYRSKCKVPEAVRELPATASTTKNNNAESPAKKLKAKPNSRPGLFGHRVAVKRCNNLKDFMRVINDKEGVGKLFQCTECEKVFKGSYELDRHVRVHTGERPYVCPVCNKGFSLTSNLYKHTKLHANKGSKKKVA